MRQPTPADPVDRLRESLRWAVPLRVRELEADVAAGTVGQAWLIRACQRAGDSLGRYGDTMIGWSGGKPSRSRRMAIRTWSDLVDGVAAGALIGGVAVLGDPYGPSDTSTPVPVPVPTVGGPVPDADQADDDRPVVDAPAGARDALRRCVTLIAGEVMDRIRGAGIDPGQVHDPDTLTSELTRDATRLVYRLLTLRYAEHRPELGLFPDGPGSLSALADTAGPGDGTSVYEALHEVFGKAQTVHPFLFHPDATRLIRTVGDPPCLDTRPRNTTTRAVIRLLTDDAKETALPVGPGYGIAQAGAVYEALMSGTGLIAGQDLCEVAKGGDPASGTWLIPAAQADGYADTLLVRRDGQLVRHPAGSYVYHQGGHTSRAASGSFYTPKSLAEVTVQLALQHRLDQDKDADGTVIRTRAAELLGMSLCEPSLGSGSFLIEAINQVAAEYLVRRQDELGARIPDSDYLVELQRVRAYLTLHNVFGVDLSPTAVVLAEVALWLNCMHPGFTPAPAPLAPVRVPRLSPVPKPRRRRPSVPAGQLAIHTIEETTQ